MKQLITFSILSIILCLTTSSAQSQSKVNTDSIPTISKVDIINFSEYLKKAASYDQYIKLNPEATLIALLNWKTEQLNMPKKQLADTPKPKK